MDNKYKDFCLGNDSNYYGVTPHVTVDGPVDNYVVVQSEKTLSKEVHTQYVEKNEDMTRCDELLLIKFVFFLHIISLHLSKLNETRWNEMYQLLLECWPVDQVQYWLFKHLAVGSLVESFVLRGQEITRRIIDEINLTDEQKTYKPLKDVRTLAE